MAKKRKIIARKHNGDDQGCWAIFVEGQSYPVVSGLQKSKVPYYKRLVEKTLKQKGENI